MKSVVRRLASSPLRNIYLLEYIIINEDLAVFSSKLIEDRLRIADTFNDIGVQEAIDGFKHLTEDWDIPEIFDHLHGIRECLIVRGIIQELFRGKNGFIAGVSADFCPFFLNALPGQTI